MVTIAGLVNFSPFFFFEKPGLIPIHYLRIIHHHGQWPIYDKTRYSEVKTPQSMQGNYSFSLSLVLSRALFSAATLTCVWFNRRPIRTPVVLHCIRDGLNLGRLLNPL